MRDTRLSAAADEPASRRIDRRTVLAGALLGGALHRPFRAGAGAATPEASPAALFDPELGRRLQQALDEAIAAASGTVPGAVLYIARAGQGSWKGASGVAQIDPEVAIRPDDRVGVGSIVKPFVSATTLQLVEGGSFSLDAALPDLLPADVTDRFPQASGITLRMLLGHRSGLPDWDSPEIDAEVGRDLCRIWTVSEFLDLAAAKEPTFPPGTDYAYSNTNYTLVGLIIEEATGRSWRDEVTDRVLTPLKLDASALPAPGDRSLGGPHAHGYAEVNGELLDVTTADPSMAGAAGGNALVTSVHDLVGFLDGLLAGRLFQRPETLREMLDFQPASEEPGQIGYGLGLLQRVLPGGIETIDHLGGAVGYTAYVARLTQLEMTMALGLNAQIGDPSPVLLPVLEALANPPG